MSWLKRILIPFMAVLMTIGPWASPAYAVNLGQAFDNLVTSTGGVGSFNTPGAFQSGVRNTFSGGGLELRVPRPSSPNATLFSFTPPAPLNYSCSGISAHFGGMSFVNGNEIKQMISVLGTGAAIGFVVTIALKVTCPMCEDVISKLREAAALAARLSMDGCKAGFAIGAALANKAMPDPVEIGPKSAAECSTQQTSFNTASDYMDAMFSKCSSLTKAWDSAVTTLNKTLTDSGIPLNTPEGEKKAIDELCKIGVGNKSWLMLSAFDYGGLPGDGTPEAFDSYVRKILLMNVTGVTLQAPAQSATPNAIVQAYENLSCQMGELGSPYTSKPDPSKAIFCPPRLQQADLKMIMGYFMCGIPTSSGQTKTGMPGPLSNYCADYDLGKKDATGNFIFTSVPGFYTCKGGASDKKCNEVLLSSPSAAFTTPGVDGTTGYLEYTHSILQYGVTSIRNNTSFFANPEKGKQLIALINSAPFPLYQVINAAAIYPSSASELLNSMTILVGQQLAVSQIDTLLNISGRSGKTSGSSCFDSASVQNLINLSNETRAFSAATNAEFAKNYTAQQAIIQSIRQINIAIQKQVLTSDMLGASRFAQSINVSVTPNVK